MENPEVAQIFDEVADLLELQGRESVSNSGLSQGRRYRAGLGRTPGRE